MCGRGALGLRWRLAILVLLALLPGLGLTLYNGFERRAHEAAEAQARALGLARLVAADQAELVAEGRLLLTVLAQLERSIGDGSRLCGELFPDLLRRFPTYTGFSLTSPTGDQLCSQPPSAVTISYADRAWFQRALATRDFVAGDYQIGRLTGRAVMVLALPVLDDEGRVRHVLSAGLDLAHLSRLLRDAGLPPGASLTLVDSQGVILARHPDPGEWVGRLVPQTPTGQATVQRGEEAVYESIGLRGFPVLLAVAPLPSGLDGARPYVRVGIPTAVVFGDADAVLARNLLALGLVGLAALAGTALVGERLVLRPVRFLLAAAERLARGDLGARAGTERESGELGELGRAFDRMAAALERRDAEHRADAEEVRVAAARSAELAAANAELLADARRRLARLQALHSIDVAITGSLDLRVTLGAFLEEARAALGVDAAAVLLLDPATRRLEPAASRGLRRRDAERSVLRLGEGHAGRAALERRVVAIPDLAAARRDSPDAPLLLADGLVARYAVPLVAKGQVRGVLDILHRAPLAPDAEWLEFLESLASQAAIAVENATLFESLERANVDLSLAYDATLEGWSRALDLRDRETEGHSRRVTAMALRLARAIGIADAALPHVRRGALLHDVGKIGIPDAILLKPGPLADDEWEIMRRHPVLAQELLSPIPFLRPALEIPYCHHEAWDGSGYPQGLRGEQVPLAARVFAVVDVWDALLSDRAYRPAWTRREARAHIAGLAGRQLDPDVVSVFLGMADRIAERNDG